MPVRTLCSNYQSQERTLTSWMIMQIITMAATRNISLTTSHHCILVLESPTQSSSEWKNAFIYTKSEIKRSKISSSGVHWSLINSRPPSSTPPHSLTSKRFTPAADGGELSCMYPLTTGIYLLPVKYEKLKPGGTPDGH